MRNIACFMLLLAPVTLHATDWPQFRGPDGRGVADDTGLPAKWSPTENIRWTADLPGRGLSCPVIAGGRAYVTACSGVNQDRLHVLAFDALTGKKLWERQLWATGTTLCHPKTSMAASTPVTDGKAIYALFATGDLVAFDAQGQLLWYRPLEQDYPTVGNNVGMAASLALWKDVLIVPMENTGDSFVAGIDTGTGKNRWKVTRNRGINWVSPFVRETGGHGEVLVQSGSELSALDPATGRKLWHYSGGLSTIPSPFPANDLVVATGGDSVALRPGADGPTVVWKSNRLKSAYATPLFYQERIYSVNSANLLIWLDAATGKPVGDLRLNKPVAASPVAADGKVFQVTEDGTTFVVQAGPEPKLIATNALNDTILATPAIANGAIFLRSDKKLYCLASTSGK
jgi:outer membrane protein assembly factor BamB